MQQTAAHQISSGRLQRLHTLQPLAAVALPRHLLRMQFSCCSQQWTATASCRKGPCVPIPRRWISGKTGPRRLEGTSREVPRTSCLVSRVGASAEVGGSVDSPHSNYHSNGCIDHAKGVSRHSAGRPNLVVQGHSCPGVVLQNPAGAACLSSMPLSLEAHGRQAAAGREAHDLCTASLLAGLRWSLHCFQCSQHMNNADDQAHAGPQHFSSSQ